MRALSSFSQSLTVQRSVLEDEGKRTSGSWIWKERFASIASTVGYNALTPYEQTNMTNHQTNTSTSHLFLAMSVYNLFQCEWFAPELDTIDLFFSIRGTNMPALHLLVRKREATQCAGSMRVRRLVCWLPSRVRSQSAN